MPHGRQLLVAMDLDLEPPAKQVGVGAGDVVRPSACEFVIVVVVLLLLLLLLLLLTTSNYYLLLLTTT